MSQSHIYLFSKTTFLLDVLYLSVLSVFISPLTNFSSLASFSLLFSTQSCYTDCFFRLEYSSLPSHLGNSSSSLESHL